MMDTIQKRTSISQACRIHTKVLNLVLTYIHQDLREQHEVRLEQGLDAFVVIDGLPIVAESQKEKLVKFLLKKLNSVGRTKEDAVFMPLGDNGMSEG